MVLIEIFADKSLYTQLNIIIMACKYFYMVNCWKLLLLIIFLVKTCNNTILE